jgi:hypothetical protein
MRVVILETFKYVLFLFLLFFITGEFAIYLTLFDILDNP